MEAFIATLILISLSEIVDKTQLVILALAMEHKSPIKVYTGALLAHATMDGFAIILGLYISLSTSQNIIKPIVGILFILLGIKGLYKTYHEKNSDKNSEKTGNKDPMITSFLTVMLSEFGDKTQIASGLLAAKYKAPITVFTATVIGLAMVIGFNVFIGSKAAEKMPKKTIKKATAILFILFGILTLIY